MSMKMRCYNVRFIEYPRYGARGITVCDRWRNTFASFLADVGPRPSSQHSIERRDNDGNYTPENCYWATRIEQANNTRRNRRISLYGRTQTLAQWCRELGVKPYTLKDRIYKLGWTPEKALMTPTRNYRTCRTVGIV
jgi:hypothetical protein